MTVWTEETPPITDWNDLKWLVYLQCEDGSYLLQENTNKILLQSAVNTGWSEEIPNPSIWTKEVI